MKLLIASDIHGDLDSIQAVISAFKRHNCDRILLLGDLLYHGPRNDLPPTYAPKQVISILNENKNKIFCVRGNCDTEVDQMVLELPILADYALLELDGLTVFATHGHKFNKDNMPPLSEGDILLHGHTHVLCDVDLGKNKYLNPGSVAIPKENNKRSFMIYENRCFTVLDLEDQVVLQSKF